MAPDTICPALLQAKAEETATSTRSIPTSSPLPRGCAFLWRPRQDWRCRCIGFLSGGSGLNGPLLHGETYLSLVVAHPALVLLIHLLHVTHELSVCIEPRMPRRPRLKEWTREIGGLPDALVLLRQGFPGEKMSVHQLTSKCGGIPE